MKNKVNFKTILILTFQLAIIIILVGFGTLYVKRLAAVSENMVKDNLRSIRYCSAMEKSLYGLHENVNQLTLRTDFETNLKEELDNITEPGEKELSEKIKNEYFNWLKMPTDNLYSQIIIDIASVNDLNITSIETRSISAQNQAAHANTYLLIVGFFGAVAAFMFTFSFIGQMLSSKKGMD